MRVVAGSLRGRPILAPAGSGVRPTADRVREAMFNVLAHGLAGRAPALAGARVLDAFAGTGALGIEALSRGAASATFMDLDPAPSRRNVEALGLAARARIVRCDVLRPPAAEAPCNLAFLDPPYGEGLAAPALEALAGAGWIAGGGLAVVELGAREEFAPPAGFTTLDERGYGAARVVFLGYEAC